MPDYEARTVAIAVAREGATVMDDSVTKVEIVDENGGEYVTVSQCIREEQTISITAEEWPAIKAAVDKMIGECRDGD